MLLVVATVLCELAVGLVLPDLSLRTISITSVRGSQQLPLSLCRWPAWVVTPLGVTRLSGAGGVDAEQGWVDPVGFEQLWLPEDLPPPSCHPALAAVVKDGVPRYLLPCLECSVATVSGAEATVWHNRGLCSVPLGSTWMTWGDAPLPSLRYSAFVADLPPLNDREEAEANADDPAETGTWAALHEAASVEAPMKQLMALLADAPDEMAAGYQYVIARLGPALPAAAVSPGKRIQLILATALDEPDPTDPDWALGISGGYGVSDTSVYTVPAGGKSEFMPSVYRPLYGLTASAPSAEREDRADQ